jgi:hypothetical protein
MNDDKLRERFAAQGATHQYAVAGRDQNNLQPGARWGKLLDAQIDGFPAPGENGVRRCRIEFMRGTPQAGRHL